MSNSKRVIKNTGFLYAKMGITIFISLYTTRLILGALGVADFGIFNIVGGAIAMLGFLNSAMTTATQRFMSFAQGEGDKTKQKYIFNVSIILHFCIALLLGLILIGLSYFFFNGILNIPSERVQAAKWVYLCMVISTIFTVMTVPYDAVLNAHENMLYFSFVGIIESILKLLVAFIIIYYSQDKLILYGILMASISFVVMMIMRFYCHHKYDECIIAPKRYFDLKLMKEMSSFAGWNFFAAFSSIVSQYGMSIVLNNFFGVILNAAQSIANQISGQLMAFSNTMMKAVNPLLAKSEGAGNRKLMIEVSLLGSKFSYYLLALFALPFLLETKFLLNIWLKNVPAWAILFTQLQIIRSLAEQLTVMLGRAISAHGDIKNFSIIKGMLNIVPITLTFVFFSYGFPPYYLYLTWILTGGIIGGYISLYFMKRNCNLQYLEYLKQVFLPCLGITVLVMSAGTIAISLMEPSIVRLVIVCISTTVTFLLSLFFVFMTKKEKTLTLESFGSILNRLRLR